MLGALTAGFMLYQWLPILTLSVLSFSGEAGGTTFPMNGVSLHWYGEFWDASIMNDFKPPLGRSFLLAVACALTTCVLSVAAAQAMRGRFRGHNLFFYLILLGIMAPGLLVGFGFALLCRILGIETAWNTTAYLVHVSWALPFGFLTMPAISNRFDREAGGCRARRWAPAAGPPSAASPCRSCLPGVIGTPPFGFSLSYDEFAGSMFTTGADITLPLAVMAQLDRQLTPELYAIGTATTAALAAGDPRHHRHARLLSPPPLTRKGRPERCRSAAATCWEPPASPRRPDPAARPGAIARASTCRRGFDMREPILKEFQKRTGVTPRAWINPSTQARGTGSGLAQVDRLRSTRPLPSTHGRRS